MEESTPRPISVTILSVFVLSITSWNMLRVYSALVNWDVLKEFGASAGYILLSGLVWAVTGAWLAYAIWSGKRRALIGGLVLTGLYFAWYWIDRLVIQAAPFPNLAFSAIVSIALVVYVIISLFTAKAFFEKEEQG